MAEIETVRRVIRAEECDLLGHLNVAGYVALASNGGFAIMAAFGLGKDQITGGRRQSFAVVHSDASFKAEIRPGQEVHVRSALTEIGSLTARFRHRVHLADRLAFQTIFTCVLMDLETRRARLIDDALRRAMEPFLTETD